MTSQKRLQPAGLVDTINNQRSKLQAVAVGDDLVGDARVDILLLVVHGPVPLLRVRLIRTAEDHERRAQ
jgi:hypothetical protein